MTAQLQALRRVAAFDAQIFDLEKRARDIPNQINSEQESGDRTRQRLVAKEAELKDLRLKSEVKDKDFLAAEQTVIKLREQINQAKSNKEFQALQHEILSKEADNARLEDDVLAQMQKVDKVAEERDALAKDVSKAQTQAEKVKAKLEKELAAIRAQIDELHAQRKQAGQSVPQDIFGKYERLIARRGQTAMVAVVNGTCQGCFMTLRPETMAQLKKGNDLVFCHSCARILYLEDD